MKAFIASLIGNASAAPAAKPRFGLVEAQRALPWIKTPEQAQAVFGVVVGVLGFEDGVAADIVSAQAELDRDIAGSQERIARNERQIASLTTANQEHAASIRSANAHKTELGSLGALFQTPAT